MVPENISEGDEMTLFLNEDGRPVEKYIIPKCPLGAFIHFGYLGDYTLPATVP
jgi:hypothetical protein